MMDIFNEQRQFAEEYKANEILVNKIAKENNDLWRRFPIFRSGKQDSAEEVHISFRFDPNDFTLIKRVGLHSKYIDFDADQMKAVIRFFKGLHFDGEVKPSNEQ